MRIGLTLVMIAAVVASCGWRGLNSLPLPGTQGNGPGSFAVQAQLPDVNNIQPNSRVRVADVTVGHVTKIERQGWHALVTMRLDGDVDLPANATAKIGTTSLLGSYHIELAPPKGEARQGKLRDGSLIALSHGSAYPSTEQTLAALSLVLNGGGLGQVQDITEALSTAFAGREHDLRGLIGQLDTFTAYLNNQSGDIIAATDSLNRLVGKFADQQPVFDRALATIPDALAVLAGILANLNTKQAYRGQYLSFNLNLNLPPPCTTGFLPAQQRRIPTFEDYPDRPAGDLYCRVPQDSPFNVRGARNIPCETVPGKRAPTVKLCESDEPYLPLNDGYNWKGDPNATVPGLGSGQDIPQTWQTMLLPPGS